jgi:hypothetical protein
MVMNLQYFGGRGGSSGIGRNSIGISNRIKKEMLDSGLKSKFKGVQRDAQNGTGNYSYKDAKAVGSAEALKMDVYGVHEKNGNTLFEGTIRGKKVFYANKDSDGTAKKIKSRLSDQKEQQIRDSKNRPENLTITSTYTRWKKNHDKNYAAWFQGSGKTDK